MVEEVNSCMIYLIYYKNLCICHYVPRPITTIKGKKERKKMWYIYTMEYYSIIKNEIILFAGKQYHDVKQNKPD
jgi:hypothetical protein